MSRKIKLKYFAIFFSLLNLLFYYYPFYKFIWNNIDVSTTNGILLIISITLAAIILNALFFYIILYLTRRIGKWLLTILFIVNAIAVYFINTYGVIIDRSMIGNIFNTRYEEASSFFSFQLIIYLFFLGLIPTFLLFKTKYIKPNFKTFLFNTFLGLVLLFILIFANASNWLWIDKNSKTLGALTMPWSYIVNTARYYSYKNHQNKKQIPLPDATIKNNQKSVVILVIGESARKKNFSLYGYKKNTNPRLSQIQNLHVFDATACATYTTAGVKCILEYKHTNKLYEILPNYLFRNGVDVEWRTTNWGEPTVKIKDYLERKDLKKLCKGEKCKYDEILLSNLKNRILNSNKNKILIILHTSTSHGPAYYKKYPPEFEKFTPVCRTVEVSKCTRQELINAYDNTIVYTDYLLAKLIKELQTLEQYQSMVLFVSDHGESLGENNLYMHGIPKSLAPKEQLEIPFIVWTSIKSKKFKKNKSLTQHNVFHTVLDFLDIDSPIFNKKMSIFK